MNSNSTCSVLPLNIYEETLNEDTTYDGSSQGLEIVPKFDNKMLCVIYLQNNKLQTLPDDFFPSLPSLMYLDLRDNLLTDIPKTIQNHQTLTHLLLQNNKITTLPTELGSVVTLKVLQLNGNPLMFPPREIINAGTSAILKFLNEKYVRDIFTRSQSNLSEDTVSFNESYEDNYIQNVLSYNSVIDQEKLKKSNNMCVKFNEKENSSDSENENLGRMKKKCPKLAKSRFKTMPAHCQSSKYVKPLCNITSSLSDTEKLKQNYLKEQAMKKHKEMLEKREKILQERKWIEVAQDMPNKDDRKKKEKKRKISFRNVELLKKWRTSYRSLQRKADKNYRLNPTQFPYDTNPDFMTLLNREDIEKDLPDKFKKKLFRISKPTVPRKSNNDVHLALKIKQLFENLEAIDLNKEDLTPRTEQKVLLNEIQKISEIKQKLTELSLTNSRSIAAD